MLLFFNKTTKPLKQFAKKKKKKKKIQKSVLGATADDLFYIFDNIFSHFFIFFSVTQFLRTLALFKILEKGTNGFGFIQGEIDINDRNDYREKLMM